MGGHWILGPSPPKAPTPAWRNWQPRGASTTLCFQHVRVRVPLPALARPFYLLAGPEDVFSRCPARHKVPTGRYCQGRQPGHPERSTTWHDGGTGLTPGTSVATAPTGRRATTSREPGQAERSATSVLASRTPVLAKGAKGHLAGTAGRSGHLVLLRRLRSTASTQRDAASALGPRLPTRAGQRQSQPLVSARTPCNVAADCERLSGAFSTTARE